MTRKQLDEQVSDLKHLINTMTEAVCSMTLDAVEAAMFFNEEQADRVIHQDAEIDSMEEQALRSIFELTVLQSPVSSDARFLMSTLAIVGELEQAGDDAVKLARRVKKIGEPLSKELSTALGVLAESVVQMLTDAMHLFEEYSEEAAQGIIEGDSVIDGAYKQARNHLLEFGQVESATFTRQNLRMIEIFHALEHIADHGVEIAKRLQKMNQGVINPT